MHGQNSIFREDDQLLPAVEILTCRRGKAAEGHRTPRRFAKLDMPGSRASVWSAVALAPLSRKGEFSSVRWPIALAKAAVNTQHSKRFAHTGTTPIRASVLKRARPLCTLHACPSNQSSSARRGFPPESQRDSGSKPRVTAKRLPMNRTAEHRLGSLEILAVEPRRCSAVRSRGSWPVSRSKRTRKLPWVILPPISQPQRGCGQSAANAIRATTPLGLSGIFRRSPRVASSFHLRLATVDRRNPGLRDTIPRGLQKRSF